jgi:hypothetical protein
MLYILVMLVDCRRFCFFLWGVIGLDIMVGLVLVDVRFVGERFGFGERVLNFF